jgi:uncharacterized protein
VQPAKIPEPPQSAYALVTGASRGLGKAFAEALAARKQNLVLVARSKEKLEALARELRSSQGILAEALEFDLASPTAGQRLAQRLWDRGLRINLLVNNAGFGERGTFCELSLDRQLEMIRLNNEVIVELTFRLLPSMLERRQGGIVNVSSTAGFQPIPYAALYAATKSFLTNFSLGLAEELRPRGVTVVTVCPGRIRADLRARGEQRGKQTFPGVYQASEDIVLYALKALDRGGGLVVPGIVNQFSIFAQRFLPRRTVPKLVARMSRPRL